MKLFDLSFSSLLSIFMSITDVIPKSCGFPFQGSREASFVDAFSAASMTTALARACAKGALSDCPCESSWPGNTPSGVDNHKWEGCSLDVRTPIKLVRKLLDTDLLKSQQASSQMTLHNYNAGRIVSSTHSQFSNIPSPQHGLTMAKR